MAKRKKKRKPILNRVYARLKGFREKFIVDIPPAKKKAFLAGLDTVAAELIEHGMEGAARGVVSGAKK